MAEGDGREPGQLEAGSAGSSADPDDGQVRLAQRFARLEENAEQYWHRVGWHKLRKAREYAAGEVGDDGERGLVRANLAHATIKGLMPHIYARNPELAITPSDAVSQSELPVVKLLAKTVQTVVNVELHRAGLKSIAKRCTRGAFASYIGWAKLTFQREFRSDPIMRRRLEDSQDDLARLEARIQAIEADRAGDIEAERERLRNTVAGLASRVQVAVQQGLVLDRVYPEHLILDPVIQELEDYAKGRFISQIIYEPLTRAQERFGSELEGATRFPWEASQPKGGHDDGREPPGTHQDRARSSSDPLVKVIERWDKHTLTIYHRVAGLPGFVAEPFSPDAMGEQWYPYFGLWFDDVEARKWPLSLVELIRELCEEYNRTRTQQAEHREISIPHWIASKDGDRKSLERYRDAVLGDVTLIDTQGRPLREVITAAEPPPYNPQIYDTAPIRFDIDQISGLQDAARGGVVRAKTATEAEILNQGLSSRAAEMQDRIEDWVEAMAAYGAEILLQEFGLAEVQRIAGPEAVWPSLDKDAIFEKIKLEIRAGTSGKPDRRQDQEQWGALLPVIQQLQQIVEQKLQVGLDPAPQIALARETVRRFDETLDVEEFFPPQAFAQGQPGGLAPPPLAPTALPAQASETPEGNVIPITAGTEASRS